MQSDIIKLVIHFWLFQVEYLWLGVFYFISQFGISQMKTQEYQRQNSGTSNGSLETKV